MHERIELGVGSLENPKAGWRLMRRFVQQVQIVARYLWCVTTKMSNGKIDSKNREDAGWNLRITKQINNHSSPFSMWYTSSSSSI